jgi:hypothetical protein
MYLLALYRVLIGTDNSLKYGSALMIRCSSSSRGLISATIGGEPLDRPSTFFHNLELELQLVR